MICSCGRDGSMYKCAGLRQEHCAAIIAAIPHTLKRIPMGVCGTGFEDRKREWLMKRKRANRNSAEQKRSKMRVRNAENRES